MGLGATVTALYARSQGWLVDVPVAALAGGAAAALAVGLDRRRLAGDPRRPPRPRRRPAAVLTRHPVDPLNDPNRP